MSNSTSKSAELSTPYDLSVVGLDLAALQLKWAEAITSNILFRSSAKNKVRKVLEPYCAEGALADIDRDLVVLQTIAKLLSDLERLQPAFLGMESLWRTEAADTALFEPFIEWAARTRQTLRALGARNGNADALRQHCIALLTTYAHLFAARGEARETYALFSASWAAVCATGHALGECIGLEQPMELLTLRPGSIQDLVETLTRWTSNLNRAPSWTKWRAAAAAARRQNISPLVDAIESGKISTDQIAAAFEYAYAKWCAEEIVNNDPILSGFLAEQHDALIEAFKAADEQVGAFQPDRQGQNRRPVAHHDELWIGSRVGRPRP